jgi:hypothetical protein
LTFLHTLFHHDPSNVYLKTENTVFNARLEVLTAVLLKIQTGQVVPHVLLDSRASGSNIPQLLDPEYTDTTILQNIWNYPSNDTASYPRKLNSNTLQLQWAGTGGMNQNVSYMHRTFS